MSPKALLVAFAFRCANLIAHRIMNPIASQLTLSIALAKHSGEPAMPKLCDRRTLSIYYNTLTASRFKVSCSHSPRLVGIPFWNPIICNGKAAIGARAFAIHAIAMCASTLGIESLPVPAPPASHPFKPSTHQALRIRLPPINKAKIPPINHASWRIQNIQRHNGKITRLLATDNFFLLMRIAKSKDCGSRRSSHKA